MRDLQMSSLSPPVFLSQGYNILPSTLIKIKRFFFPPQKLSDRVPNLPHGIGGRSPGDWFKGSGISHQAPFSVFYFTPNFCGTRSFQMYVSKGLTSHPHLIHGYMSPLSTESVVILPPISPLPQCVKLSQQLPHYPCLYVNIFNSPFQRHLGEENRVNLHSLWDKSKTFVWLRHSAFQVRTQ